MYAVGLMMGNIRRSVYIVVTTSQRVRSLHTYFLRSVALVVSVSSSSLSAGYRLKKRRKGTSSGLMRVANVKLWRDKQVSLFSSSV